MNPQLINCRKKIEGLIQQQGWCMKSYKSATVFMPGSLNNGGCNDKKPIHNEVLILNIEYGGNCPVFKSIILPGNGSNDHNNRRKSTSNKLIGINGAASPKGQKYLVHFNVHIDCTDLKSSFDIIIEIVNSLEDSL